MAWRRGRLPNQRLAYKNARSAGKGEVQFDASRLVIDSTEASNHRRVPIGMVVAPWVNNTTKTLRVRCEDNLPVLPPGGGTLMHGQGTNVAVVIDTSKYLNRVLQAGLGSGPALVEPAASATRWGRGRGK